MGAHLGEFEQLVLLALAPRSLGMVLGLVTCHGADDTSLHAVAVQHFLHFFFGQKNIVAAVIGHQKTVAVAMAADTSFDKVGQVS